MQHLINTLHNSTDQFYIFLIACFFVRSRMETFYKLFRLGQILTFVNVFFSRNGHESEKHFLIQKENTQFSST
ncbi:hypothetical protein Y032_0029g1909 [Ancylostoma ceylanicum]|uniref:Uncharacterized protein n=1 Tax=Ancylostoma ceylanicum TaxID=53326 RepID=A0A016UR08_9BILA|nr:hypothetical protein Y032_0029g1909 [Ancylostoma ceylanicum]